MQDATPLSSGSSTLTSCLLQYINVLIGQYSLRVLPKKKPVIGLDDLYLLLYTHWVLDDATYSDERQRLQVATGILAAVFFGCRPCSLFDTRVKFDDPNESDESPDATAVADATKSRKDLVQATGDGGHRGKRRRDDNTPVRVDSGCDLDSDTSTGSDESSDSDSIYDSESDHDSDSSSIHADEEDLDTDDDCDTGPEETRSFLYRHFTISIVASETPGKPNLVFMKATLLHTKGEDNHPRV